MWLPSHKGSEPVAPHRHSATGPFAIGRTFPSPPMTTTPSTSTMYGPLGTTLISAMSTPPSHSAKAFEASTPSALLPLEGSHQVALRPTLAHVAEGALFARTSNRVVHAATRTEICPQPAAARQRIPALLVDHRHLVRAAAAVAHFLHND